MNAKKTKSGKWHAQATYKDQTGIWRKKSFTADSRKEAIRAAEDFEATFSEASDGQLADMIRKYIDINRTVLSVNTITGYEKELRCHILPHKISACRMSAINDVKLQEWVSDLCEDLSVKSVKNAYGLISATVRFFQRGRELRVKFPQEAVKEIYIPKDEDLRAVIALADPEMQKAIRIAMYCGLRQGEIAALMAADIDRSAGMIRVTKAQARTAHGEHVIKPPKTRTSIRSVPAPDFLLEQLPKAGRVVDLDCDEISWKWQKLVARAGVPHFNFHALRKYSASVAIAAGCGMETVKQMHGWSNSYTALTHYIRPVEEVVKAETAELRRRQEASQI